MKRITFFITLTVFAVFSTFSVSGQKTDFSGTWKLDRTKSTLLENLPTLARISIDIKGDSLFTERVYEGGDGQEYPFNENLTLDSKEHNITIYDMPRKSKASWSEQDGLTVESTTTSNDGDFVSKETWKADVTAKTLTISFKNSMAGNVADGVFILNRVDQ
jgi:hypothetical protein